MIKDTGFLNILIRKWMTSLTKYSGKEDVDHAPLEELNFNQLIYIFKYWSIGLCLAFITFIVEIISLVVFEKKMDLFLY